ncbi:MAG: PEP-CTERM sorting domain-containing protein [Phycisphaerae bacterium]|nr:PEP-CTERM sorting domain-containing protein [Phycisphaerae bacterium]
MNKLTFSITAAAVSSLFAVGTSSADFQGISIEALDSGMGIGTTYRIYADVDGGEVDAVYGDTDNALHIEATTSFYQNQFGGYGTPSAALFGFFPSLEYDSFVTIGLLDDAGDAMLDIGIDFTGFEAGGAISTDNGTWFATPDEPQVLAVDGRVLIAQLTTDGDINGVINLQGKNDDLSNWNALGVEFSTVPAPGAIALLGLAGVASRRRRK